MLPDRSSESLEASATKRGGRAEASRLPLRDGRRWTPATDAPGTWPRIRPSPRRGSSPIFSPVKRFLFGLVVIAFSLPAARATNMPDAAAALAHLRPGHPRLLLTDAQLADALAAAKTDPLRAALHARIIELATAEIGTVPIERVLIGPRLLDKSRTCIARVLTCAMAYRLTHDQRFAARARHELLTAAAFSDWNPSHFLDVAEMSFAFAIGYDWLYDYLTPDERRIIREALLQKGTLAFARAAYAPGGPTNKQLWFVTAHHNWNQVCNGGMLAAALALADEEPELARIVIDGARQSLPLAMAAYQPDGAYPEGPGYWDYGTGYNVLAIALLESALGTDLGLGEAPAFDRTARYRLYVQSPTGLGFNYADGGAGLGAAPEYTWLASRFDLPFALAHSRALLEETLAKTKGRRQGDRFFALHAVWFPSAAAANAPQAVPPLDARFRGPAELAIFRSAWNDPRALFVGFKAGRNDVNHAHLDLGSFVLDADGVRWAEDLGPDNYNLPAYFGAKRWSYFRLNNRSHNTITPGALLQSPKAVAPIVGFASTPARAFAVADLTNAYPGVAQHLLRGIALLDRARVLVQDDVTEPKAGTVFHWRLVTGTHATLEDAHHVMLTSRDKKLRLTLLAPDDARFTTSPATPDDAAENQNVGTTCVTATATAATDTFRFAVLLEPIGADWPATHPKEEITPLADWR